MKDDGLLNYIKDLFSEHRDLETAWAFAMVTYKLQVDRWGEIYKNKRHATEAMKLKFKELKKNNGPEFRNLDEIFYLLIGLEHQDRFDKDKFSEVINTLTKEPWLMYEDANKRSVSLQNIPLYSEVLTEYAKQYGFISKDIITNKSELPDGNNHDFIEHICFHKSLVLRDALKNVFDPGSSVLKKLNQEDDSIPRFKAEMGAFIRDYFSALGNGRGQAFLPLITIYEQTKSVEQLNTLKAFLELPTVIYCIVDSIDHQVRGIKNSHLDPHLSSIANLIFTNQFETAHVQIHHYTAILDKDPIANQKFWERVVERATEELNAINLSQSEINSFKLKLAAESKVKKIPSDLTFEQRWECILRYVHDDKPESLKGVITGLAFDQNFVDDANEYLKSPLLKKSDPAKHLAIEEVELEEDELEKDENKAIYRSLVRTDRYHTGICL